MHGEQSVPPESYSDRLVAFRDEVNLDLALGIVEAWDQDGMKLMVRTPLKDAQKVTTVVIGTLNVTLAR
jgi:polynucleotide 5'-kinase involved in rRNA processing